MRFSGKSARRIGILLVGLLLLGPGLGWAAEEELKESGAKAPAGKTDDEQESESAEAAKTDESCKPETATIDFNTLEDISAFRGSLHALWTAAPQKAPIEWSEVVPSEQPAPESAPLSNTRAR